MEALEDLHSSLDKVDQGQGNNRRVVQVVAPKCHRRPKPCLPKISSRGSCSSSNSSTLEGVLQPTIAVL